jgi:hypothetical protein
MWRHLLRIKLPIRQLVEWVQGDVCGPDIIQVPAAVYAQVCANGQPQMALALAAPVLQNEPCNGAPLAHPSACTMEPQY